MDETMDKNIEKTTKHIKQQPNLQASGQAAPYQPGHINVHLRGCLQRRSDLPIFFEPQESEVWPKMKAMGRIIVNT